MTDNDDQAARRARRAAIRAEVPDEEAQAAHLEAAGATDQPDQPGQAPDRPTRDAAGNLTGTVHLADGTTQTVDQLTAWADHDDQGRSGTDPDRPELRQPFGW